MHSFSKSIFWLTILVAYSQNSYGSSISTPKISEGLLKSLKTKGNVNILINFVGGTSAALQAAESSINSLSSPTHVQRASIISSKLREHAQTSQKVVISLLVENPLIHYQSYWITNQIYIKNANFPLIQSILELDQVSLIEEEVTWHIQDYFAGADSTSFHSEGRQNGDPDWGLVKMRVPEVWNMPGGVNGSGLIIGNIDTGVRGTHELIRDNWMGPVGGWFDPERLTANPHDVYNHGTHTMGTLVGKGGLGIAPAARWTACKGYRDDGSASSSTFIACGQFMLCPTDTNGQNPDCNKTPHVVSNSWGWTGGATFFNPALQAWTAAGILSSFSAGNTGGDGCGSIYAPADQRGAMAIGATGQRNELASWSSLGPSPYGELKPEISAPGITIMSASAVSDTAYMTASGTSMSCPNASGVLALLKAADLNLMQARALQALIQTAVKDVVTSGRTCGGVIDTTFPNNHHGHGVVDAFAAIQWLKN